MPDIIARDKGEPANTVSCRVVVRLYGQEQVVQLTLFDSYESLIENVEVFAAVLEDVLKEMQGSNVADLYVVEVVAINDT